MFLDLVSTSEFVVVHLAMYVLLGRLYIKLVVLSIHLAGQVRLCSGE